MATETTTHCKATIGKRAGAYGFEFVLCQQQVGVRGYWAKTEPWENTGHFVAYCAIPGHEQNVRRRFPEVDPPEPAWDLAVEPEAPDPIDAYKVARERGLDYHAWQAASLTEAELLYGYSGQRAFDEDDDAVDDSFMDEPEFLREGQPEFNGAFR